MMLNTLYLKGFSHRLFGRPKATPLPEAARVPLDGLALVIARFIPAVIFAGAGQRHRVFTPWVTFCAFVGQCLQRDGSCREAVRRVQAWRLADGLAPPDDNSSAYCQSRVRLPMELLRTAHERLVTWLEQKTTAEATWCGRTVRLVDGSGFSMPDTADNRALYPYAGGQRKGCGFPTAKLVGLFSLAGHLVRFAHDSWKSHDISLARLSVGWVQPREVLVGDRAFCGWGLIALLRRKDVEVVFRLHQARAEGLGPRVWRKPKLRSNWTQALWAELPSEIPVRVVRFQVSIPGFRTTNITLVTTLLDTIKYPDSALAELYRRRWLIETCFRDLKTTLGLDVLRGLSPIVIERELIVQTIAYNLIRALLAQTALTHHVPLARLSFKGAVDTLRQWVPLLTLASHKPALARRRYAQLLLAIAADLLPLRPNRSEPRAVKRRPKPYQLLTKPRRSMLVSPSRRR